MNEDLGYKVRELKKKNQEFHGRLTSLEKKYEEVDKDWDNATLMRNWGVSKRTTKNYRDKGLEYYRLGNNGPIFYTYQAREAFKVWNRNSMDN